jgi:ArsR family transcriptional regulator
MMNSAVPPLLSDDRARELAEMFHLMGEPNRLRLVLACLEAPAAAGDLARRLGLSASLASHHLRLLRAGRLLKAQRQGKQVFYEAADDHVRAVMRDMVSHVLEPEEEHL